MGALQGYKSNGSSLDSDTDSINVDTGVMQGHAQARFPLIIFVNYVLRTLIDLIKEKENGLSQRSQELQIITDADYGDDLELLSA